MPILSLSIIYLCIMIIIFIYDIYLLKKAMKMKKKNILHYCVFNIILSNFCHIFYYTINFWKDFYSNDFFVKLCYFQASMINSHPIITDLFIFILSINILNTFICGFNVDKISNIVLIIINILVYIIPMSIYLIVLKEQQENKEISFNEVFCFSGSNSMNIRKVITITYSLKFIIILITIICSIILFFLIKKQPNLENSVKIFYITFVEIIFSFPSMYIRIRQYYDRNYDPKTAEMWIICYSYLLAGIFYPYIFARISGLTHRKINDISGSELTLSNSIIYFDD